jgi:hypothetical protein
MRDSSERHQVAVVLHFFDGSIHRGVPPVLFELAESAASSVKEMEAQVRELVKSPQVKALVGILGIQGISFQVMPAKVEGAARILIPRGPSILKGGNSIGRG